MIALRISAIVRPRRWLQQSWWREYKLDRYVSLPADMISQIIDISPRQLHSLSKENIYLFPQNRSLVKKDQLTFDNTFPSYNESKPGPSVK